ncbi:MAG: translational GTPase TypA [Alphaproteobacteria bacterium]
MDLRNVAIIAHVDHGKTTLVDQLLKQSGAVRDTARVEECAMDSGDLERERGITILAKATSVEWQGHRINIVDTPGHADFGGEVERILSMVDGVVLLVDAAESVMPQTKFVLSKALRLGLKPIVVINKIDRPDSRTEETLEHIFDLFLALEANDDQLEFRVLYASGRQGWAVSDLKDEREGLTPLFQAILETVPAPKALSRAGEKFALLATILEADPFLGRILTGRIESGSISVNQPIKALTRDGKLIERGRATKILAFRGLERRAIERAEAGDIIAIAGLTEATVADTICDPEAETPIAATPIDPPTLAITVSVNDSPLAGREGSKVQSRVIRARLMREAEGNVAIRVTDAGVGDSFEVAGRGELQLGVLIETMRREGFELSISRPRVLFREDPATRARLEPIEEVIIDVDEPYSGTVIEKLAQRKGELRDLRHTGAGKVRIVFHAPSRGLIGYHGEFLTDTRGTGVMNRIFHEYGAHRGQIEGRRNGVLISNGEGTAVTYALWYLEERGRLFVTPGTKVYLGMIIGEHSRDNDLDVNPLKEKQLTNIRTTSKDEAIRLTTVQPMTLEQAIAYIEADELVEVTPKSIRLRKKELVQHLRKKAKEELV